MTPTQRRASARAAACGLLAGLALGPAGAALALLTVQSDRSRAVLARTAAEAERYVGLAARLPSLQQRQRAVDAAFVGAGLLVDRASPEQAIAMLQEHIGDIVAAAGGTTDRIAAAPAEPRPNHTRLSLEVRFQAPPDAVLPVLAALEASEPLLLVRSVAIARARPVGLLTAATRSRLEVDVALLGFAATSAP